MSDNTQKTPLANSLQKWGRNVARTATNILGQSVPATLESAPGPIVSVNYEVKNAALPGNVQMPVAGSRYYRAPYQAGEKGMAVSADYYMGGMSGLGGGTADLSQHGNLATQAWMPVGHKDWPSVDPNVNTVTGGPGGILLRDGEGGACKITVTSTGVVITVGACTVNITASGITCTQGIQAGTGGADSVTLQHHIHDGPPPVPGT